MPEPLFLLSAPRCFSSVFGAMLGQHPQAYGLPELNLFLGDTLGEAWGGTATVFQLHDGLLRTLAQLNDGEQTDDTVTRARKWVLRRTDWPIDKVFSYIQEAVGPRVLVEKGPSVAFSKKSLERMYRFFPKASYLHLVRHPRSMGKSLVALRQSGVLKAQRVIEPDRVWQICNYNITPFAETLPLGQSMRIKGEAVMSDPYLYLPQIAEWLGLDADPESIEAMLHPEASPYARIGPEAAPYGNDPNFLKNPELDWDRLKRISESELDGELDWRPGDSFTKPIVKLARQFGYS